jgi:hypothetical protein
MEQITPILQDMGIRHGQVYGVQRIHYDTMTEVFITILTEYLTQHYVSSDNQLHGTLYGIDVAHAWAWWYV